MVTSKGIYITGRKLARTASSILSRAKDTKFSSHKTHHLQASPGKMLCNSEANYKLSFSIPIEKILPQGDQFASRVFIGEKTKRLGPQDKLLT